MSDNLNEIFNLEETKQPESIGDIIKTSKEVKQESDFDVDYTDVSPAFDFEQFIKYIEKLCGCTSTTTTCTSTRKRTSTVNRSITTR